MSGMRVLLLGGRAMRMALRCEQDRVNLLEGVLLGLMRDKVGRCCIEPTDAHSSGRGLLSRCFRLRLAFHLFLILT